jgi:hypothetical protein
MSLWTRSITGRQLTVVHRNCFITVIEDTRSHDAMRKIRNVGIARCEISARAPQSFHVLIPLINLAAGRIMRSRS